MFHYHLLHASKHCYCYASPPPSDDDDCWPNEGNANEGGGGGDDDDRRQGLNEIITGYFSNYM